MSEERFAYSMTAATVVVVGLLIIGFSVLVPRGCASADAARIRACADACGDRGVLLASTNERNSCVCRP